MAFTPEEIAEARHYLGRVDSARDFSVSRLQSVEQALAEITLEGEDLARDLLCKIRAVSEKIEALDCSVEIAKVDSATFRDPFHAEAYLRQRGLRLCASLARLLRVPLHATPFGSTRRATTVRI